MAFSPSTQQVEYDANGNPVSPTNAASIAAAAGVTVVKGGPGRVAYALVTTAATEDSNDATIYDNAGTDSGTILGLIPGSATAGEQILIGFAAENGITVVNVADGPAFTLGYS